MGPYHPNTCVWCVTEKKTWDSSTRKCLIKGGNITNATDCYKNKQYPKDRKVDTIKADSEVGLLGYVLLFGKDNPDREIEFTFNSTLNKEIVYTLLCEYGSISTYAMYGPDQDNLKEVNFPCNSSFTAGPNSQGVIDFVSNEG